MVDHLQWCVECGNVVRASTEDPKPSDCPACGASGDAEGYPWTRFDGPNPGGSTEETGKDDDEIYRDRNIAACALVEAVGSGTMGGWTPAPDEDGDEWAIVWLELPHGQVSWHVPREMAESLVTRNDSYDYDGHTREQKNDILASWADDNCPR